MPIAILVIFILGYIFIILEHQIRLDKAAVALITGVVCWTACMFSSLPQNMVEQNLFHHIGEISGILFFLIGAMTIVELIDLYDGFQIVLDKITTRNKRTLLIIFSLLSFFLSALLDNLTTAIVMSTMMIKIIPDKKDRLIMLGMIVIASNAGGAWSPIGDVTTTMLWIGHQITAMGVIKSLFIPSLVAVIIPLLLLIRKVNGEVILMPAISPKATNLDRAIIFYSGIGLIIMVPIFKSITHLPPFMGMMLAVGLLWTISETLHKKRAHQTDQTSSIFSALERIDMPSILFFMGILLAVGALQTIGLLDAFAHVLTKIMPDERWMVGSIGLLSAVFDNVPLVAAIQGMFNLQDHAMGSFFWNYLAFCSGTGGSLLIIGSAAGVAVMGIEKISFLEYFKQISLAALLGFLGGALTCILLA